MCFRFVIPANANLAMQIEGRPKQDLEGEERKNSAHHLIVLRQEYPSHALI